MSTIAMLLGGVLGLALRNSVDPFRRPATANPKPWRAVAVSVIGGLLLGVLTGLAFVGIHDDSPYAAAGIITSSAATTYCVFGAATVAIFRDGLARHTIVPAVGHLLSGFAATTAGFVLGAALIS